MFMVLVDPSNWEPKCHILIFDLWNQPNPSTEKGYLGIVPKQVLIPESLIAQKSFSCHV